MQTVPLKFKMKSRLLLLTSIIVINLQLLAVPADNTSYSFVQPNGSTLNISLIGDEFYNFTTTTDGYTVIKNEHGYFVYANIIDNQLIQTDVIANDVANRSNEELKFLAKTEKFISLQHSDDVVNNRTKTTQAYSEHSLKLYDYSDFKGLVILVEFTDRQFIREDSKTIFDSILNQPNFDGFMSNHLIPSKIQYTGSVRDYFYDNSMGIFNPHFDVVGPVKINYSQTYINQTTYASAITAAACRAADEYVNFKDYDRNNDNKVDMVYFIFAGGGSNVSSNNSSYIWPHASTIT